MKKTLHTLAMLAAALATTGACLAGAKPGGKKITLKQKYVPGDYLQTLSMQMDQAMQVGAREIPANITMELTLAVRIGKPDKTGARKMTWEYRRIKRTMVTAGITTSYDSAAPKKGDPNLAKAFGALAKAKIAIIIGPDDKIKTVTGLDKMWDKLAKKDPALAPTLAAMKKSMGNKMIKDMVEKSGQNLPEKPVAVGEEWVRKHDVEIPILGKVKMEMKCKLKAIEAAAGGKRAVMSITGKLESTKPTTTTMGIVKMTVRKLVMNMTGEHKMNIDNPVLGTMTLTQTGSMEMQMQGQGPSGQQPVMVESKFTNKMVMKTVKAQPPKDKPAKTTK